MDTSPLDRSPRHNWVEDVGGLPLYIRAVAHAIERRGEPRNVAIRDAIGQVKRHALGLDGATPKTRARAAAAIAELRAKGVRSRAQTAKKRAELAGKRAAV